MSRKILVPCKLSCIIQWYVTLELLLLWPRESINRKGWICKRPVHSNMSCTLEAFWRLWRIYNNEQEWAKELHSKRHVEKQDTQELYEEKNNFLKRWLHNDVFILQKDYKKRMLIAKVLKRNVVWSCQNGRTMMI